MPWGYECKQKLLKQVPAKPTQPRAGPKTKSPGPSDYETPTIYGGKGYSRIRRAPAYTFGHNTPVNFSKPVATEMAKMVTIENLTCKGPATIPYGLMKETLVPPPLFNVPGPGAYDPKITATYKCPPAYTIKPPAKGDYQPWDMWTPGPNMYHPPIFKMPRAPAYTIKNKAMELKRDQIPDCGTYNANYRYAIKNAPKYSFMSPFKELKTKPTPEPNKYCAKKFMYVKKTIPSYSFGIKHTPYRGYF